MLDISFQLSIWPGIFGLASVVQLGSSIIAAYCCTLNVRKLLSMILILSPTSCYYFFYFFGYSKRRMTIHRYDNNNKMRFLCHCPLHAIFLLFSSSFISFRIALPNENEFFVRNIQLKPFAHFKIEFNLQMLCVSLYLFGVALEMHTFRKVLSSFIHFVRSDFTLMKKPNCNGNGLSC